MPSQLLKNSRNGTIFEQFKTKTQKFPLSKFFTIIGSFSEQI